MKYMMSQKAWPLRNVEYCRLDVSLAEYTLGDTPAVWEPLTSRPAPVVESDKLTGGEYNWLCFAPGCVGGAAGPGEGVRM